MVGKAGTAASGSGSDDPIVLTVNVEQWWPLEHRRAIDDGDDVELVEMVELVIEDHTSVGQVTDDLTEFLGLPDPQRFGMSVPYALTDPDGDHLDQRAVLSGLDVSGVHTLGIDWLSLPDRTRRKAERELAHAIKVEVNRWLDDKQQLVLAQMAEAERQVRQQVAETFHEMAPKRWRGVIDRFRKHRALKRLTEAGYVTAYEPAARAGLELAAAAAGPVAGAVAGAGSGGVSGGNAGAAAGAGVAAAFLLFSPHFEPPEDSVNWFAGPEATPVGKEFGVQNDLYLSLETGDRFRRGQTAWEPDPMPAPGGEQGPKGDTGERGPKGDDGSPGPAGTPGPAGLSGRNGTWTVGLVEPPPDEMEEGQLFFNRCSGVLSLFAADGWQPVAALSGTGGLAGADDCPGLAGVGAGGSLWQLVTDRCPQARTNRQKADAVAATWAASLNLTGGDMNSIEPESPVIVRCG